MGLDMMGALLKGVGFDADGIAQQAQQLIGAIQTLALRQTELLQRVEIMQGSLDSLMAYHGLYVPPASEAMAAYIARESARHIALLESGVRPA